jgi:hypothetical protein
MEYHVIKSYKTKTIFDGTKNEKDMKQILLVLFVALSLASCSSGNSDDVAALQRKVDSLTKLVPTDGTMHVNRFSAQAFAARGVPQGTPAAAFLVAADGANKQIQEWHALCKKTPGLDWNVNKNRTAFMVPAVTLDTLINHKGADYVVFYFGINASNDNKINLFYTGVKQQDTTLTEMEFKNGDNVNCVFDMSFPCPQCNSVGIHVSSNGIGGEPPASVSANVIGGNGKISPDGISTYYTTPKTVKFSFTPDQGFTVDEVKLNGVVTQTNGRDIDVLVDEGSQELTVSFKQQ